jgi:hypothetical protein
MASDNEPASHAAGESRKTEDSDAETRQKFVKAYEDLMQALHQAWNSEDDARQWREANEELHRAWTTHSAPDQCFERAQAYAEYLRRLREIAGPKKTQGRIDQAFKDYIKALDESWTKVGADVHPETLSLIGQSIAWAGHYASFRAA